MHYMFCQKKVADVVDAMRSMAVGVARGVEEWYLPETYVSAEPFKNDRFHSDDHYVIMVMNCRIIITGMKKSNITIVQC